MIGAHVSPPNWGPGDKPGPAAGPPPGRSLCDVATSTSVGGSLHHKPPTPDRSKATVLGRPPALRAAALAVTLAAGAAHAETPPRCTVLGQVAMLVWLDTVASLGAGESFEVTADLQRLDRATAVYARTGCDTGQLAAAMDCLLTEGDGTTSPRVTARDCLATAGLLP